MQGNAEGFECGNSGRECRVLGFDFEFHSSRVRPHKVARYYSYSESPDTLLITNFRSLRALCRGAAGVLGYGRAHKHAGDGPSGCMMIDERLSDGEVATYVPKPGTAILETAHRLGCG